MSKLSLVCLTIAVCAFGSCLSSPLMNRIEADGAEKYLNCVEKMQVSSEHMKAPFEVLIQGPSADRFVRSLMAVDESSGLKTGGSTDSRLTFSVHQPETEQSKAEEPPKEATKDADKEKNVKTSCGGEDLMNKDENISSTPETEKDASPSTTELTLRSKRQSGDEPQPDGPTGEVTNPEAQRNDPKVGGPFGLLGPAIAAHVGIPAAIGLGHLGLLNRGLRVHSAVGLHHALLPLRHALHHVPLVPLLGAANPNANGEPVGQENPNAQAMPMNESAPPQAAHEIISNAGTMFQERFNQRMQALNQFRQQMMPENPANQGPTPAPTMREQSTY